MRKLQFYVVAVFAISFTAFAQKKPHQAFIMPVYGGGLPPDASISTPNGKKAIRDIQIGDEVWSVSYSGKKIPVKVLKKVSHPSKVESLVRYNLKDGRSLTCIVAYPDKDNQPIGSNKFSQSYSNVGDVMDGSPIEMIDTVSPPDSLMSILPDGVRASMWVNDILVGTPLLSIELNEIRQSEHGSFNRSIGSADYGPMYKWMDEYGIEPKPDRNPLLDPYRNKTSKIYNTGIENWVVKKLTYPDSIRTSLREREMKVYFVCDENGSIRHSEVFNKLHPKMDEIFENTFRVIPKLTPAKKYNLPVTSLNWITIKFDWLGQITGAQHSMVAVDDNARVQIDKPFKFSNGELVYTKVDKQATYSGGDTALLALLSEKMALTDQKKEYEQFVNAPEGMFSRKQAILIISKAGKVLECKLSGINSVATIDAVNKILMSTQGWVPAEKDGKKVNAVKVVYYSSVQEAGPKRNAAKQTPSQGKVMPRSH